MVVLFPQNRDYKNVKFSNTSKIKTFINHNTPPIASTIYALYANNTNVNQNEKYFVNETLRKEPEVFVKSSSSSK